jgi:hypothetical protein
MKEKQNVRLWVVVTKMTRFFRKGFHAMVPAVGFRVQHVAVSFREPVTERVRLMSIMQGSPG